MSKKLVDLTLELDGQERSYQGRFIGLIKDDEFNALSQDKRVAQRVESKATSPLDGTIKKFFDSLKGYRVVLTIKKINGVTVGGKKLLVTERLEEGSMYDMSSHCARLVGESGNDIYLEEKEV